MEKLVPPEFSDFSPSPASAASASVVIYFPFARLFLIHLLPESCRRVSVRSHSVRARLCIGMAECSIPRARRRPHERACTRTSPNVGKEHEHATFCSKKHIQRIGSVERGAAWL